MSDDEFLDLLADPEPPRAPLSAVPEIVGTDAMADLLGVTANRIQALARDGALVRVAPGRYDLRASLRRYTADLRDKARGRAQSSLAAEKERLARENADKVALQNAKARAELVPAPEVERAWAGVLRDVRAGLLAVPA
ncbi:MAG: hypothetical protein ACE369_20370, partial [Roseovarius sp.]